MSALGAEPVLTGFAQIVPSFTAGNTDCAITGTMSGNTLGLHTLMTHVHALPVTWGLAVFGANRTAWAALPADLRELLRRELPKLESSIWAESNGRQPMAWPATGGGRVRWWAQGASGGGACVCAG